MQTAKQLEESRISASSLKEKMDRGDRIQIIDVRSVQEFTESHIPGAVNVPMEQVEARLNDFHAQDPAVLVCHSGRRAEMCREVLQRHREDLTVLEGGTAAWVKRGYPTVKGRANRLPLMRQVQLTAGLLALTGAALGYWVNPNWNFLAMFIGAGLTLAGSTGFCGMAILLGAMPWNRSR